MRRHLGLAFVLCVAAAGTARAERGWMFKPGRYSHDPASGARVGQFQPPVTPYFHEDPTYSQSGYRQNVSRLYVGGSGDFRHIVETWGQGDLIRPYGEWLYPYRAGATPYGPWGNPQGPWTLPFDSWINPYGASGRYYPGPYPYGSQGQQGPGFYSPLRQGAGAYGRGAYPYARGYAGGYPGGYPGGQPGGPGGYPGGYPGGQPGGPGGYPGGQGGNPPPQP